jgi:acetyl-CoA acetyltransferase family protein
MLRLSMVAATENRAVILGAIRTPFGKFGGALKNFTATDLGVLAAQAAVKRTGVRAESIDHVIFGNALQTSSDAIYLARHIGLRAGIPPSAPGLTLNRLCGSGFQSIITGAQMLLLGEADFVLAGGTESMSQAPYVLRNSRWGMPLGKEERLEDSLWSALTDSYCDLSMAETAEKLGSQYGVTREEADEFAYQSQIKTKVAKESGRLSEELAPIEGVLQCDEHPRPETTREALSALPPVFKENGLVTAGNASGICDGAAAVILTTVSKAKAHHLAPIAKIISWGIVGCDASVMGIGPAPAIRKTLDRVGLSLDQIDLIEVNEAFAAQYLAVERELGLNRERVNVNGGAIALGHPLGATGARITASLVYELRRRGARFGLGSACIGGGQGIALLIENLGQAV